MTSLKDKDHQCSKPPITDHLLFPITKYWSLFYIHTKTNTKHKCSQKPISDPTVSTNYRSLQFPITHYFYHCSQKPFTVHQCSQPPVTDHNHSQALMTGHHWYQSLVNPSMIPLSPTTNHWSLFFPKPPITNQQCSQQPNTDHH